jgi:hypothetical protein
LTCPKLGASLKSVPPPHTNARSPNSAQAVAIIAMVSAGDSTGMLPVAKQIGGDPAATHAATSSSTSVVNPIVSAPTKGRWPSHFAHSAANPGTHTSS